MTTRRHDESPRCNRQPAAPNLGSNVQPMTGSTPLHIDRSSPAWALQEALDRLGHTAPTRRPEASIHSLRPGIQKGEASTPKAASKKRPGSVVSGNRAAIDARATVLEACDALIESLDMLDRLTALPHESADNRTIAASTGAGTPENHKPCPQNSIDRLTSATFEKVWNWQEAFDEIVGSNTLDAGLADWPGIRVGSQERCCHN